MIALELDGKDLDLEGINNKLNSLKIGELLRVENLDNEIYHACDGISNSKIKVFLDCPKKYWANFIDKSITYEYKSHFAFGDAGHTMILEPSRFEERYIIQPSDIKVRRGAKWDEFQDKAKEEGKKILTSDQYLAMPRLGKAIEENDLAKKFLRNGKSEVSYFKIDKETELLIKCRVDYEIQTEDGLVVSDLKTTDTANPKFMDYKFKKMGYYIQDAFYTSITSASAFVFVAIEKDAPHVITAPVVMSEDLKKKGRLEFRRALNGIKSCLDTAIWPSYVDGVHEIKANNMDLKEIAEIEESL